MKNIIRILSVVLVLSMLLTGCSMWKPTIEKTPEVAATYGDGLSITTGEYLAYLYNAINDTMSAQYQLGKDATTETYTFGDKKDLSFNEYIPMLTEKNIKEQIVLDKLIKDNGIKFESEEDFKPFPGLHGIYHDLEEARKNYESGWILPLGISDESYNAVEDKLVLNRSTAFYGLYGKGGANEIEDKVLREYYNKNYVSYKVIAISLQDENKKDLSKEEQEKKIKQLESYLTICNKDNFEKAYDQFRKDLMKEEEDKKAEADKKTETDTKADADKKEEEFEASKEEDTRINAHRDEEEDVLEKELDKMKNGEAKVIKKLVYREVPYAVMLQKVDINNPKSVYEGYYEVLLEKIQDKDFDKMLEELIAKVEIKFDQDVLDVCTVEQMLEDMEKASA